MASLERRVRELETEMAGLRRENRAAPRAAAPAAGRAPDSPAKRTAPPVRHEPPARPASRPTPRPAPATARSAPSHSRPEPIEPREKLTLEDILNPRNLAIAGAAAVLVGLVFLVSYGISNGWISESVRVIGAAVFSLLLAGAGMFIQERRRAGAPAQALAVAGAGGLFLSLVAATRLYDLIDPAVALVAAAVLGVIGTALGMRWKSEPVAGAIIATSLISPLLLGVTYDTGLLAFLMPLFAFAVAAAILKPWVASFSLTACLFLGSLIACVVDAEGGSTVAAFGLATVTLLLCGAGSFGYVLRVREADEGPSTVTYGIFVAAASLLGMLLVSGTDGPVVSDWGAAWFTVAAAFGGAVWWAADARGRKALSITAFSLASAALATALGFLFEQGPMLTAAWSVQAACLIALGHSTWQRAIGYTALCLAGFVVLAEVPPDLLVNGSEELLKDLAVIAPLLLPLAATVMRPAGPERDFGAVIGITVLAYMGMLTGGALIDPGSVVNLIPLAVAAAAPMFVTREDWTQVTFAVFGFAAVLFSLLTTLPPDALVDGVPSALDASISGTILVGILLTARLRAPEVWRRPALWGALGLALYVVSALIIDSFQGTSLTEGGLPGTAQGQVIVSSLWALSGLGLIIAGLRLHHPTWRKAGLILLILSMAKITLYDLASLSSAGRMISFILVGLALLAAAFAYQWMSRQEVPAGVER